MSNVLDARQEDAAAGRKTAAADAVVAAQQQKCIDRDSGAVLPIERNS